MRYEDPYEFEDEREPGDYNPYEDEDSECLYGDDCTMSFMEHTSDECCTAEEAERIMREAND